MVIKYCNIHQYIPLDIIKVIIIFFNHIIYYQLNPNNLHKAEEFPDVVDWNIPFPATDFWMFQRHTLHYKSNADYAYNQPSVIIPDKSQNIINHSQEFMGFEFELSPNISHSFTLQMIEGWDDSMINNIVLRLRIFCVQNNREINSIVMINSDEKVSINNSDITQLQVFESKYDHDGESELDDEIKDIGAEIEIVHILYNDNNYWSRYPYSWFGDVVNGEKKNEMMYYGEYKKYFDSRSFKIGEECYYLLNEDGAESELEKFMGCYCKEMKLLSNDIVLLRDNGRRDLLFKRYGDGLNVALKEREEDERERLGDES